MTLNDDQLLPSERAVFALRRLYLDSGYKRYKVSKFEEYDLYAQNKSFLSDKSILTFTDTDGRLMALKPDITLSIIKNTKDTRGTQKVFYNECVYRASDSGFRELMQTGLECIGDIDINLTAQVISLAYKSLECIGGSFLLDLSNIGFTTGMINAAADDASVRSQLMSAVQAKSVDAVAEICGRCGADLRSTEALKGVCGLYGRPDDVIAKAKQFSLNGVTDAALETLERIVEILYAGGKYDNLRLDFSILNDTNYYNSIIFKGFIDGIPQSVLSGGRYDSLLEKLGKSGGAIGFAVYLDGLDRLFMNSPAARTCGGESIDG